MSERTAYPFGSFCWIDLGSHDLETTKSFYTQLFGWTAVSAGPDELTGGYGMFQKDGLDVAGYGPAQAPGQWWSAYICVEDADASISALTEAGGSVIVPAMDVMTAGRMAVCIDPTGAVFSLWQPGDHIGARRYGESGTWCWTELMTRDLGRAIDFYTTVFGWSYNGGPDVPYTEWSLADAPFGGAMPMPADCGDEVPPSWQVYFAVDDLEATTASAVELGATLHVGPTEAGEIGKFVMISAPGGEMMYLMQFNSPPA